MKMSKKPDLNDVKYDAYLTNYKTLKNPEIVPVTPGQTVRLRVINGSGSSNFFVKTGSLKAEAIATDGNDINPFPSDAFQLAVAQRLDILVKIPEEEGAYPILAQGEGTRMQTGLILATPNSRITPISEQTETTAGSLNDDQERQFKAHHARLCVASGNGSLVQAP